MKRPTNVASFAVDVFVMTLVMGLISIPCRADERAAAQLFMDRGGKVESNEQGQFVLLQLEGTSVQNEDLRQLAHLPHLERLYLADTDITDDGLVAVGKLPQLRRLSLWNTSITDEGVGSLAGLAQLEALDLNSTQISDFAVRHLQKLRGLVFLNLSYNRLMGNDLDPLAALPHLKYLDLSHNQIGTQESVNVGKFDRRVRLNLIGNQLSIDDLARQRGDRTYHLAIADRVPAKWAHTDTAQIHVGPGTSIMLSELGQFPYLRQVDCYGCNLTQAKMDALGAVSSLNRLTFRGCRLNDPERFRMRSLQAANPLQELHLIDTVVPPEALSDLHGFRGLRSLTLSNVDDRSLKSILDELEQLNRLRLDGCRLTDVSVELLSRHARLSQLSIRENRISENGFWDLVANSQQLRNVTSDYATVAISRRSDDSLSLDIDLHQSWKSPSETLASLQVRSVSVENLDLQGMPRLQQFRTLAKLSISSPWIDDEGLENWQPPPSVTRLGLDCPNVTDKGLDTMRRWQSIEHLSLVGCNVSDRATQLVVANRLKTFETDRCRIQTVWGAPIQFDVFVREPQRQGFRGLAGLAMAKGATRLRYWDHSRFPVSSLTRESEDLQRFDQLQSLDMMSLQLTTRHLRDIAKLTSLRELKLGTVNKDAFDALRPLSHLESLSIDIRSNDPEAIATLNALGELRRLQLSGDVPNSNAAPLRSLRKLTELNLAGLEKSDHLLPAVADLPKLKQLALRHVTDASMSYISQLSTLTRLDLSYADLSDNGLAPLGNLGELEELRVAGSFSGAGLENLAALRKLKVLTITGLRQPEGLQVLRDLPIERLTLSGQMDADGFRGLSKISSLRELYLYVNDDDLAALVHLAELPHLRVVSLWEASPTQEVLDLLPDVEFRYEGQ